VSGEEVESLLAGSEGLNTTDIAARAGADRERVLTAPRELEAGGRVRRSGTRWHAITDEHRIAQRTAESAAQALGSKDSVPEGRA
jgi:hypothetical protein